MTNKILNRKSKYLFLAVFILLILVSSDSYAGFLKCNSFIAADTNYIDSIKQPVNRVTDSSKLFANLLSSSNNQSAYNFSINPEAKLFVDDYIRTHTAYLNNMKTWGKPYFDLYDKILGSYGLPLQLKYLSVIESSLNSDAISWAGAVGPWQNNGCCCT